MHIIADKQTHRRGLNWARKFMSRQSYLDRKLSFKEQYRTPLTDEQRETKRDLVMELSGQTELAKTFCPKCKRRGHKVVPIEHTSNPLSWNIGGALAILCYSCGGEL
jgi:hypothetical protein